MLASTLGGLKIFHIRWTGPWSFSTVFDTAKFLNFLLFLSLYYILNSCLNWNYFDINLLNTHNLISSWIFMILQK